jgi:hypothetical protein
MPESATQPQHGLHDPDTIKRESSRWIRAQAPLQGLHRDRLRSLRQGGYPWRREAPDRAASKLLDGSALGARRGTVTCDLWHDCLHTAEDGGKVRGSQVNP